MKPLRKQRSKPQISELNPLGSIEIDADSVNPNDLRSVCISEMHEKGPQIRTDTERFVVEDDGHIYLRRSPFVRYCRVGWHCRQASFDQSASKRLWRSTRLNLEEADCIAGKGASGGVYVWMIDKRTTLMH
jgi:hypothetical protein